MKIEVELADSPYGEYGWKVCDACPCLCSGARGMNCGMEYWKSSRYWNGMINIETGERIDHLDGERKLDRSVWLMTWIRPQECIDKHGR